MSHTLHRYGINEADLQDDYVVFAIAAQTVNAKGIHPQFREFEKIVMKYNPVNYGDMRTGNKFNVGMETVGSSYHDNSIVHAVFTDESTVTKVLKDIPWASGARRTAFLPRMCCGSARCADTGCFPLT